MFKGLGNFASLMKQAPQIMGKLKNLSEELREKKAVGTAGGGMVELEVNGLSEVLRCSIDPSLLSGGDKELLEDLIVAAANQATAKARQLHADAMKDATGGLNLPGMDEAFSQLTGGPDLPPDDRG